MRNPDAIEISRPSDRSTTDLLDQLSVPSRLGHRPGLERIRMLLAAIGNPHDRLRILHVGGTSGKGSTATIAACILSEAGYRVGLHVKPHLEQVEERFVVDGAAIQAARLAELIGYLAPAARQIEPSWYELTVAIAFEYFRQERVDLAVVEVGLGGTFDATNVVNPAAVALTNVDLDHVEILGDTVEKIASDKAGIIKSGVTAVSGATQTTVQTIVANRCDAVGARLWQLGRDIGVEVLRVGQDGSQFNLWTPRRRLANLILAPLGAHQVANAAIALAAVDALTDGGTEVPDEAVRRALASVNVPGRLEVVGSSPLLLLDGAHNPAKMESLRAALECLYPARSVTGVLAFKRGHDLAATIQTIAPRLNHAYLTQFDATTDYGRGQSVEPWEIEKVWRQVGGSADVVVEPDPIDAVRRALASASADDVVCVTGSLYLVGVIRSWVRSAE